MNTDFVIDLFCEHFGINRADLFTKKSRRISGLRSILYKILRDECGLSSYKLSRMFGITRRNVVRALGLASYHIEMYNDISSFYVSFKKKLEGHKLASL